MRADFFSYANVVTFVPNSYKNLSLTLGDSLHGQSKLCLGKTNSQRRLFQGIKDAKEVVAEHMICDSFTESQHL